MKILKSIKSRLINVFHWFQHTSLKKKLLVIVIAAVILFLVAGPLFGGKNKEEVTTDTVKKATIVDTVSESGSIQSNQLTVYSISSGVIEELYVTNGQTVQKGENLFMVKSTASDQDKAEAWANYQSALSSLKTAEQNKTAADATMWSKQKTVLDTQNDVNYKNDNTTNPTTNNDYTDLEKQSIESSLIQSRKDFTAAEQKYKEADVAIASAKAQVNSTWIKYQATQNAIVTAQVAGVIENLSYGVGDQVTAAMTTSGSNTDTSASPVLVIGTSTENIVKIQINEIDINKIKVGQTAKVTINAIKDKTFTGEVTRVDRYGTDTSGIITYNVFVKITDPDDQIKPLMSAVATIQTTKHENALVVPNSAVKPYKGGKAVQVKDTTKPDNQLKYIQVKTGIKSTNQTEILDGVTEGMEVVTGTNTPKAQSSGGGILGGPPGN